MIWKQLAVQLRLLLAEWLLARAFDIAPEGDHGDTMRTGIFKYFEYATKEFVKDNKE